MSGELVGQASSLSKNPAAEKAETRQAGSPPHDGALRALALVALLSTCLYGGVDLLGWQFDYDSVPTGRPIIAVLILFAAAFPAYLLSIRLAWRATVLLATAPS